MVFIVLLLAAASPPWLTAHPMALSEVWVTFRSNGSYHIDFLYDLNALLVGKSAGKATERNMEILAALPEAQMRDRLDEARDYFTRRVFPRIDGDKSLLVVYFPDFGEGLTLDEMNLDPQADRPFPGQRIRLAGEVPEGAEEFVIWFSKTFGPIALKIREDGRDGETVQPLGTGQKSEPFSIGSWDRDSTSRARIGWTYLKLGFTHILPKGLDHILFVLGLFLLSLRLRPLVLQVSAFTIAHSITLALSVYGVFSLPRSVVEPLIAASIAFVAIENLITDKLKPWRIFVVFGFGLLHGLGFAIVLTSLGLPRREFVTALLTFNCGVELGQLAVIAAAWIALGAFREKPWYRARVVIPASAAIASVGVCWTFTRIFFA